MIGVLEIGIEGIGVWSPELANWDTANSMFCGNLAKPIDQATRPAATILPPNERRRAPEAVLLALEAAQQACAMAQRDPTDLPNVFASAYGDLVINDYMCSTLATAPLDISPTRFHNSVHNAPAGYWAIAAKCMRASTAMSAGAATFGAGLLEATLLALDTQGAVLYVASDVAAVGPLKDAISSRTAFAVAFVLAPPSANACARLRLKITRPGLASAASVPQAANGGNPIADSLPLLRHLAQRKAGELTIAAGPELNLCMETHFD
ncbi:MAG: beta-ketoacyl synthase chain length factor [Rudaea sp.]